MGKCVDGFKRRCLEASMGEGDIEFLRKPIMDLSIAKRMITNRMPTSMREEAQSSIEPKAMGVKISRAIRTTSMTWFNIVLDPRK